jgi:hypothetical protein
MLFLLHHKLNIEPMRVIIILILILTASLHGYAQYKYEKEYRVKQENVPALAVNYLDSLNFKSKVKWYKEIGINSNSFEAKTKYKGKKYSVEFSEEGFFEDIEIEIELSEIPSLTLNSISKYLAENYSKYKIEKVQVQYSGNKNLVFDFLLYQNINDELIINYEIILSSKIDGAFKMFEFLFSNSGNFIQKKEFVLKRTDNIEY